MTTAQYAFDNRADEARDQLGVIETQLDPITVRQLDRLGVAPGANCWEVGAGAGSIARWLADRAGPAGRVLATDLDPARLSAGGAANLRVLRHDVREEPPPGGPFDVIHARLVLLHLPERREVLATLAKALKPGGVLLVEEFDRTPPRVLRCPDPLDAELFQRVVDGVLTVLTERGADLDWAGEVPAAMAALGLTEVHTAAHAETWRHDGGGQLHDINSRQLAGPLQDSGLTRGELERFRRLVRSPEFAALSYTLVSTSGRRV